MAVYFSEDWKSIAKSQLLILLDGFDEVKTEERDNFLRRLGAFKESNPIVNIIISTRTNFVSENSSFPDFEVFYLSEFDDADIRNYVEKLVKPDRVGEFLKYINEQHIKHWISSPYNLSNFIEIFNISTQNLPKTRIELIESIIQLKLKADLKYRFTEFQQLSYQKILEKLAFSLTLYGVNSVSNTELMSVFPTEEIEILKKMSVLNFEDNYVKFSHNVLQEFLTAKLLSLKNIDDILDLITFKPRQKIKPKWYNTISILIETLPVHSKLLETILLFISDKEPSILNQIEFKFIPFDLRLEAFKIIISDPDRLYKQRGLYTNNLSRFGGLDENEAVLEFLIKFIESNRQDALRQEGLYCLSMKNKETLWGYEDEIIELLQHVIQQSEDLHTKYLCINVLNVFQLFDAQFAVGLKKLITQADDYKLIDEIIEYFNLSNKYDEYIEIYFACLAKYEKYSEDSSAVRGYGLNLQNGLKGIKSAKNINKLLDYLIKNIKTVYDREFIFTYKFYDEETFLHSFTNNLIEAYEVDRKIKNKVLNFLENSNFTGNDEFADDISRFFFKTNTNQWAFWRLWKEKKDKNRSFKLSLGFLADEHLLLECKNKFIEGEIVHNEIWGLIHYLNIAKRNELAEPFRSEVNELSNNYFTYTEQKDYTLMYELRRKKDFELLINKPQFIEKTYHFFEYYEKSELAQDEVLSYKKHWEDIDNEITGSFLLDWFRNREDKEKYKVKKSVIESWFVKPKNWKNYVVGEAVQ